MANNAQNQSWMIGTPCSRAPAIFVIAYLLLSGCKSPLDVSRLKANDDEKIRELASIEDTRGPLERVLQASQQQRAVDDGTLSPAAGLEEYEAAEALFDAGKLKKAEKAFRKIAKNKKYKESPVIEDALFMIAESQFERKRYSFAQDSYNRLMKEFPSSRYLDQSTKRMFEIARTWLDFPEVVTQGDIQQVNLEDPRSTPKPDGSKKKPFSFSRRIPIFPNAWDRTRPVFDTDGRALQALKSIWLNDPTGPLADDALMLTASHYLRKGDYLEADRLYSVLREEYPNTPHLENAFVLGSHVKLMSYQGPAYEGKHLEASRQLKESTLRLFPNHPDRERLREEIANLEEAKAKHEWELVRFWQKKKKPKAVAVYCKSIIETFPESSYADRAREELAKLEPKDKNPAGQIYLNDLPEGEYDEIPDDVEPSFPGSDEN